MRHHIGRLAFVLFLTFLLATQAFAACSIERKDAIKDQTITTGTATFVLSAVAPNGARTVASAHTSGCGVRYRAVTSDGAQWEDGEGVVTNTSGTWSISRVTVFASSNSNALVSFSAGTKSVLTGPVVKDFDVPDWATGASIASATTINLDTATGGIVHVTGTTTIGTVTLTRGPRLVVFDGALTLTHNSTTNNLPGAANIVTAAGDRALYVGDGTTAYCISFVRAADVATTNTATQTLSGKTLTAPVINGMTGDTSAWNVGSGQLTKDTSGNFTAAGESRTSNLFRASNAAPAVVFYESDQGTGLKNWWNVVDGAQMQWQTRDDADGYLSTPMVLSRAGALTVTRATDGSISSVGSSGYGSFTAQGSGTNPGYLFFVNGSGERSRISSGNTSDISFSTGTGAAVQFQIAHTASAVNNWQATGAAAGGGATLSVVGSDTNAYGAITTKGSGSLFFYTNSLNQTEFEVAHAASAVNRVQVGGGATTVSPYMLAAGSDSNIGVNYSTKGTGVHLFYTNGFGSAILAIAPTNVNATTSITSSSPSGGIGYATGAGGTVTQTSSKSTGVTINKVTGQITTASAAFTGNSFVTFTVTNSTVAATDGVTVWVASGGTASAYVAHVTAVAAGSFAITLQNITGGSLTEQPVIGFIVLKGVTS